MDWQTIETAPRDGSEFLMETSGGWVVIASSPHHATRYAWWRTNSFLAIPIVGTHPGKDWDVSTTVMATGWMPLPKARTP